MDTQTNRSFMRWKPSGLVVRLAGAVLALGLGLTLSLPASAEPAAASSNTLGPGDMVLRGDAKCTGCHDDSENPSPTMLQERPWVLSIAKTKHGVVGDKRTPTCASCHGESEAHMKKPEGGKRAAPDRTFGKHTANSSEERSGTCLTCHKGGGRTHWEGAQHASHDVSCNNCHQVHAERDKVLGKTTQLDVCFTCHKDQRADIHKYSTHPLAAGKMACSDCHNPHGSAGPKLLKRNTLNETCFLCHAEKRGPMLWEHQPVTEDCGNCHRPHGSNISPLLKTRPPFMCSECHDGPHNSKTPYAGVAAGIQGGFTGNNPTENAGGRACMNCHSMIHGSNHPAGALLQR
jgi:DmsE family decaheme c-type cytochrome